MLYILSLCNIMYIQDNQLVIIFFNYLKLYFYNDFNLQNIQHIRWYSSIKHDFDILCIKN